MQVARLGFSEHAEVVHQAVEVQSLAVHCFQIIGVGRKQAILHGFDVALDVGEGSAQFVGDVGHQIATLAFRILQSVSHVVESVAEFGNFVIAAN